MGAPAPPPTKPALRTKPRPIPRELRAKRDDEVREESSIVWRAGRRAAGFVKPAFNKAPEAQGRDCDE